MKVTSMDLHNVCQRLQSLISTEELRIRNSMPNANHCMAFIEIARAVDNAFLTEWLRGPDQEGNSETLMLCGLGSNRALQLFHDDWRSRSGVRWHQSVTSTQEWADSVIQHCGRLGVCELLVGMIRAGLVECVSSRHNLIRTRYTDSPIGIESIERSDSQWVKTATFDFQKPLWESLDQAKPDVLEMMYQRVDRWKEHFITYETHPVIDEYFDKAGLMTSSMFPGYDAFPGDAVFGNVPFGQYVDGVATLIGWSRKHIAFVIQLLRKCSDLDPRNLATVFGTRKRTFLDLADVIGTDEASSRQIVDVLTLGRGQQDALPLKTGGPPPPFIVIANGHLLHLLSGCLINPFAFLLDSLKHHFRRDWDSSVDRREVVFRSDLYGMFPDAHLSKIQGRINLREDGQVVTDIDAALFNRKAGTVGLFQLKWQDLFGTSMRQRESQKRNLLESGNRWIERVTSWLQCRTNQDIGQTLRLDATDAQSIRRIRLFVIGRNAAHFSGGGEPDPRAAWGHWAQVQKLAAEKYDGSDPVEWLHRELQQCCPRKKEPVNVAGHTFSVGGVKIVIEPPKRQIVSSAG